jgi:hypothetical protein
MDYLEIHPPVCLARMICLKSCKEIDGEKFDNKYAQSYDVSCGFAPDQIMIMPATH